MDTFLGVGLFAMGFISGGTVAVIALACVIVGGGK
jgi:hypothetical protein